MSVISRITSSISNFFKTPFKKALVRSYSRRWLSFFNRDLATNETIFSAINMRSNAVASAPVGIYRNGQKLKPSEHDLAMLFKFGPNKRTTMFEFMKLMETNKCSKGCGYAIIEYDNNYEPSALWPLDPGFITPMIEKDSNELYYCVRTENGPYYVHESNVIAVPFMKTGETTYIKPLDVLKNSIDYDNKVKEFSLNQMKNALDINYVFKMADAKLNDKNKQTYDQMIQEFFDEGIAIVDAGSEVQQLASKSYLDPNISAIDNITIERVERVFSMIGKFTKGSTKNTGNTDTEDLIYLKDGILPIIRQYEQELTKKLVTYPEKLNDYEIKLSMQGFARAQMSVRGSFYQITFRNAIMSRNEIRALEDLPPVEGGDKFYLSRDLWDADNYEDFMKSSIKNPTERR